MNLWTFDFRWNRSEVFFTDWILKLDSLRFREYLKGVFGLMIL